jgi:hypothetical protein
MPVDPTQLVEVLGVTELPDRPGTLPAAAMTLQTDPCAYVVCCLKPQPVSGRMRIWRKVYFRWSDDQPRRPYLVELFDADGRLRVVAHLAAYAAIAADGQEANPPVMPTDIRLTWPAIRDVQPGGSIHLVLSEMSATRDFDASVLRFALPAGVPATPVDSSYGPSEQEHPGR